MESVGGKPNLSTFLYYKINTNFKKQYALVG